MTTQSSTESLDTSTEVAEAQARRIRPVPDVNKDDENVGGPMVRKKVNARTSTQRKSRESTVSSVKEDASQRGDVSDKETEPVTKRSKTELQAVSKVVDWQDLDAGDCDDPLMVSEYVTEIFKYMQELEVSHCDYQVAFSFGVVLTMCIFRSRPCPEPITWTTKRN